MNPAFGNCFSISFDHSEIESLFPPTSARHTAITEPADSQLPPDHERRVFTFDNDDVDLNGKHNESEQEYEEEDEDDDIVAEQLVVIPRSSLPESRPESSQKNLARTTPASDSSRKALDASEEPDSTLRLASQSPQRPTSAFKARKVPASSSAPTIQPRLSKAAALRMGIELSERKIAKAEVDENGTPVEKEEVVVPGTIRRTVTPPKSLSKPTVAPRQNRASALRTADGRDKGGPLVRPSTKRRESLGTSQRSAGFEGLPGFAKRPVQPPNPPKDEVVSFGNVMLKCFELEH